MDINILVPLAFLLFVFLGIRLLLTHQHKKRVLIQQTLQTAMNKGQTIPEQTWQRFLFSIDPKRNDLRRAIQFLVLALMLLALAWLVPFQDPQGAMVISVIAVFPLGISLLYTGFWLFWYPRVND